MSTTDQQEDINDKNLLLFAMRHYTNTQCSGIEEFQDDFSVPVHIKKLLTRYQVNGCLKSQLIINHVISFLNVFEADAALSILFFRIDQRQHIVLKTILVFLRRCPDFIMIGDNKILNLQAMPVDPVLLARLKEEIIPKVQV